MIAVVFGAVGCMLPSGDSESSYEQAVTLDNGDLGCTNPKKVLVCHIPPGNPDNAHTICVGAKAVKAHVNNHGDTAGACSAEPGGGEGDDGDSDGDDEDEGDDDDTGTLL